MRIETVEQYDKGWSSDDREDTIMKQFGKLDPEESCRVCANNISSATIGRGCSKWCCDVDLNEICFMFEEIR